MTMTVKYGWGAKPLAEQIAAAGYEFASPAGREAAVKAYTAVSDAWGLGLLTSSQMAAFSKKTGAFIAARIRPRAVC